MSPYPRPRVYLRSAAQGFAVASALESKANRAFPPLDIFALELLRLPLRVNQLSVSIKLQNAPQARIACLERCSCGLGPSLKLTIVPSGRRSRKKRIDPA